MCRARTGDQPAALAFAAFQWQRREARRDSADLRREATLLSFDYRAVTAITFETGGEVWRLESRGSQDWRIVSPIEDAADPRQVEGWLETLRRSQVTSTIEQPEPLASYGLDPPRLTVRLEGVDAPAFLLGGVVPTRDGAYASIAGRPGVRVVGFLLGSPLTDPDLQSLRDRRLLDISPTDVAKLALEGPGDAVRLAREPGGWWVVEPVRVPASERAVGALIEDLTAAQVSRFVDGTERSDPTFGLDAEAPRLRVASDEVERVVQLGADAGGGGRYCHRADRAPILVVDAGFLKGGTTAVAAWIDTKLTKVNRYHVRAFRYRRAGGVVDLKREGGAWRQLDGTGPVDEGEVYALLVDLLEAPVEGAESRAGDDRGDVAELIYELEDGSSGRIVWPTDREARRADLPGVAFRMVGPPPPIPAL